MLDWLSVSLLITIGLLLIMIELIFVPGTTIVGIAGLACLAAGVFLSFQFFGPNVGWVVMIVCSVSGFGILVYGLRSKAWEKFSLKRALDSKVNEEYPLNLEIGQVGQAISALRPMGNAEFGSKVVEVSSHGNYVKTGQKIQIVKIDNKKVYIEPYENK